ncbi:MAG: hypothetical protein ABJA70_03595 [Chryseolinea sp.]
MAFQKGLINLEGRIDNLTFFQTKYGTVVRKKSGISGDRLKKDPVFVRARENMSEFGRSGKATKLIRAAFKTQIQNFGDDRFTQRLVQTIMRIIKSDNVNGRGERNFVNGDVSQMLTMQFNMQAALQQSLLAPFTSSIDRQTGRLIVEVPGFVPADKVSKSTGATHFRLIATAAELDFAAEMRVSHEDVTHDLVIGSQVETVKLMCQLPESSSKTLLLTLGIQFGQVSNGTFYPHKDKGHNAMAFIQIDKPA